MPWLTPDYAAWQTICYRVYLPDDDDLRASFRGSIRKLGQEYNWEQQGTATPEQVSLAFQALELDTFDMRRCMPIGTVIWGGWSDVPEGYLLCDGTTYDTGDYSELYDAIGYNFGGSGSSFKVPDLINRVAVGSGDKYAIGATGGAETHTLNNDELSPHNHSVHEHLEALAVAPGELPVSIPRVIAGSTGNTGGGNAHNNMQPYTALMPVISYR